MRRYLQYPSDWKAVGKETSPGMISVRKQRPPTRSTLTHLIQQQDVGSLHTEHRESDTRLLTSGEGTNLLQTGQSGNTERTQMISVLLFCLAGEHDLKESDRRQVDIERVDVMLGKVCDTETTVSGDMTGLRLQSSRKKLDKCRFTCSVRTNDGDTTVQSDVDVDAVKNFFAIGVSKADLVELQERWRDLFWIRELEGLRVVHLWWLQFGEFLQDLDFGLSLRSSVGVVPPPVNECLKMLPVLKLGVVLLAQVLRSLRLGGVELGEVTLVVVQTLTVLVYNIGGDGVEESSVVGSEGCERGMSAQINNRLWMLDVLTRQAMYQSKSTDSLRATQWRSSPTC